MTTIEKLASKIAERRAELAVWNDAIAWAEAEGNLDAARDATINANYCAMVVATLEWALKKVLARGNYSTGPVSDENEAA